MVTSDTSYDSVVLTKDADDIRDLPIDGDKCKTEKNRTADKSSIDFRALIKTDL